MNFKEFIEFTGLKFLFSLIMAAIGVTAGLIAEEVGWICLGGPCTQPALYYIFRVIAYIFLLPALGLEKMGSFIGVLGVILTIPYIYLIACLISLLIEKIKASRI